MFTVVLALVLAVVVYLVLAFIGLPSLLAGLVALLVFLAFAFGGRF